MPYQRVRQPYDVHFGRPIGDETSAMQDCSAKNARSSRKPILSMDDNGASPTSGGSLHRPLNPPPAPISMDCRARPQSPMAFAKREFQSQREWLGEIVFNRHRMIVFTSKFHPEFNWIKMFWSVTKRSTRKNCTYSFRDLGK